MPFLYKKKKNGDKRIGMKYHRGISRTKNTVKALLTIPNSLQETCFANHSANFLYLEISVNTAISLLRPRFRDPAVIHGQAST